MKLLSMILTLSLLLPGTEADTGSWELLNSIWQTYDRGERFAVYGGHGEAPVPDGPGQLDIRRKEALTEEFCVPPQLCFAIKEGASLVHLMNRRVFSAAVFHLAQDQDPVAFGAVLRGSLRNTKWENGRPERYLIALPVQGYVLVAFGSRKLLNTFLQRTEEAFPQGQILYDESVPI